MYDRCDSGLVFRNITGIYSVAMFHVKNPGIPCIPRDSRIFCCVRQGPGPALPVLGFAHKREGGRSDQGQSSHGGKDLWPADGGGTGAGAGRCDGAGSLVPLHLPVRGRDHHPGHQPAPGDHPELRLSSPGGDPDQEPGPGSPAPRPHRAALPPPGGGGGAAPAAGWAAGVAVPV